MSETKKSVLQSWLPVLLTAAMLLTSLGSRGGAAESQIRGLREELVKITESLEKNREETKRISEALVEARGYREGLQTRLAIVEKRLDAVEAQHDGDLSKVGDVLTGLRSLIENNKTTTRLNRGLLEQYLHGKLPAEKDG